MSRARSPRSPWDRRRWWTAPFRWAAFPFVATARPFFQWMACTRGFACVGPRIVPRLDRAVHLVSGGRLLMSRSLVPTLLLITTGHRTGHQRRAPMTCLPEPDGSFLVVGSNWGRASHPNWSISLLRRPEATVSYRGHQIPVTARLLEGLERDQAWPRLLEVWPVYDRYALRSGRRLRVFRLEPRVRIPGTHPALHSKTHNPAPPPNPYATPRPTTPAAPQNPHTAPNQPYGTTPTARPRTPEHPYTAPATSRQPANNGQPYRAADTSGQIYLAAPAVSERSYADPGASGRPGRSGQAGAPPPEYLAAPTDSERSYADPGAPEPGYVATPGGSERSYASSGASGWPGDGGQAGASGRGYVAALGDSERSPAGPGLEERLYAAAPGAVEQSYVSPGVSGQVHSAAGGGFGQPDIAPGAGGQGYGAGPGAAAGTSQPHAAGSYAPEGYGAEDGVARGGRTGTAGSRASGAYDVGQPDVPVTRPYAAGGQASVFGPQAGGYGVRSNVPGSTSGAQDTPQSGAAGARASGGVEGERPEWPPRDPETDLLAWSPSRPRYPGPPGRMSRRPLR